MAMQQTGSDLNKRETGALIGSDYYPLPWSLLKYNELLGGYEVNVTEDQLRKAPKFRKEEPWAYGSRDREKELYSYYNVTPYW